MHLFFEDSQQIKHNLKSNMSSTRARRRKTLSPKKLVAVHHVEDQQGTAEELQSAADTVLSDNPAFEDPKDLADYIMHNAVINFVQPPRLSQLFQDEVSDVKLNTKPGEEMVYNCRGCYKKTYRSVAGLKAHIVHCPALPKAPYICAVCNESFTEQVFATDHIKDVHVAPYVGTPHSSRRSAAWETTRIHAYESGDSPIDEDKDEHYNPDAKELAEVMWEDIAQEQFMHEGTPSRKKQNSARKTERHSSSQIGTANTYSYLNAPLAKAFKWTFNRYKDIEKKCSPNATIEMSKISSNPLSCETLTNIFHLNLQSPTFAIETSLMDKPLNQKKVANTKADAMKNLSFKSLGLFKAIDDDTLKSQTFYAGAPVWAMAWCPYPCGVDNMDQVLSLTTHTDEHLVTPTQTYDEPAVLQLWNCGNLHATKINSQVPRLADAFTLKGGPVWDLQWCPFGGFVQADESTSGRLGILALAMGCGYVNVLAIPSLTQSSCENSESKDQPESIKSIEASITLKPMANEKLLFGQCFSVTWSVSDGCGFIAGGFASGHVAIWDVNTTSKLLLSHAEENGKVIFPILTFRAHSKPVMGIAWCPFDEHVVATAGADRFIKVWDRRRPECDLKDNVAPRASLINEICWPYLYNGVYAATDSSFSIPYSHGCVYASFSVTNSLQNIFPTKACCFTVTCSDWLNSAAGGDTAGNAMVYTCNNLNRSNSYMKKLPRMLLFQSLAQWSDESETTKQPEVEVEESYEYKLVFFDSDMTKPLGDWEKRLAHKEIRTYDDFADEIYRPPVSGVLKMRWNPNKSSFTWIASGTHSGLVRLHCVSGMISRDLQDVQRSCEGASDG